MNDLVWQKSITNIHTYSTISFKIVLHLGKSGIILGYVYRISINGNLYYSDNGMTDKSENSLVVDNMKKFSHVKFYASSPIKDAFTADVGNVWKMILNGEVLKGIR